MGLRDPIIFGAFDATPAQETSFSTVTDPAPDQLEFPPSTSAPAWSRVATTPSSGVSRVASQPDRPRFEPVAIVGIGCAFPGGPDRDGFWNAILRGDDAIRPIPPSHWRPEDYLDADPKAPDRVYAAQGGFLDPIEFPILEFGVAPQNLEATDTTQLLGLVAAQAALADAGLAGPHARPFDRAACSVILGVTGTLELVVPLGARLAHPLWRDALRQHGVPEDQAQQIIQSIADRMVPWQENSFPGLLGNVAAGRIANRLDLHGSNCVVDAACASSLAAIHLACLELQTRRADLVLSGGLDTFNDIFMYMCFSKTPALSPSGQARPFDAGADGTTLGEGLGVVVLKRLADAEAQGDRIYAVIRGLGSASDGKGSSGVRAAGRRSGPRVETRLRAGRHRTGDGGTPRGPRHRHQGGRPGGIDRVARGVR
ncbi:Beta-ketoacyl synthase [Isosphaera pallida ATCC 43644]|uniref:Beta-ketoacyl synthase n=1 Tax=Isosphaera pallida (strain ATCC 43644 / DSM 9630 / IS1B) TaxID=575540 RepID=E8R363_ISOPI|nr:beta-ketoacyl synthase N-terminal-like domain-containing protein [Isosphaera pallida]ADV62582.1 Beta-ketoacyl synthase [Isosphaera pallida ATCC 43644]